jgi:hypothetical protein
MGIGKHQKSRVLIKYGSSPYVVGATSYQKNSAPKGEALDGLGGPIRCQMRAEDFLDLDLQQS